MDKSKESISVAYKFTETMREKIGEDVPSWLERALREAFLAGVKWHTSQPAVEAKEKDSGNNTSPRIKACSI